jgi:SAM-dependent methyltransferase
MDWRLKCAAHWLFSLPGLGRFYYKFKRHVARSVFRRPAELQDDLDMARRHFQHLSDYVEAPPDQARCMEFGAGRDLINNLCLWCLGVDRQLCVDLNDILQPELVNSAIQSLHELAAPDFKRLPDAPDLPSASLVQELRDRFGIDFRAPFDARATGLPDGSLDFIYSTNTLEHVPPEEIMAILIECRRVLAPNGALSFKIDYADHYSYADKSISAYNFLRFSPGAWRVFNPPLHYQSRLRHADYAALFMASGFEILSDETILPTQAEAQLLAQPLSTGNLNRPWEELLPTSGWFVLATA